MELRLCRHRRGAPERGAPGPLPRGGGLRAGRRADRRLPRVLGGGAGGAAARLRPGVAGEGAAPQTGGARTVTLPHAERQTLGEQYAGGPARLRAALATVPAEAVKWRPAPKEWSVHEILCHRADSETNRPRRSLR